MIQVRVCLNTLGHRLCSLRVRTAPAAVPPEARHPVAAPASPAVPAAAAADERVDDRVPGLLRAAVRTGLLLLVVPAVVQDGDGRSLHDRAAGTVIVRR